MSKTKRTKSLRSICKMGILKLAVVIMLFNISFVLQAANGHDHGVVHNLEVKGVPATGPNRACDKPLFIMPYPFPPTVGFSFLGEYNTDPGAVDAIPLSEENENCNSDTILATTTNLAFQDFFGFPDADQRLKNKLIREVPVLTGLDGVRGQLSPQGTLPPNPLPPIRSVPNNTITLGDWFSVKSTMKIKCRKDGTTKVKAEFKNLIPNGLYAMFGIWKTTLPGTFIPTFMPVAFGGFPNLFVADSKGKGKFERILDYCPMDPTPDGSVLMFVDLAYYADGNSHGGFPFTPLGSSTFIDTNGDTFESTRPAGIVTFVQAGFPITVEKIE